MRLRGLWHALVTKCIISAATNTALLWTHTLYSYIAKKLDGHCEF